MHCSCDFSPRSVFDSSLQELTMSTFLLPPIIAIHSFCSSVVGKNSMEMAKHFDDVTHPGGSGWPLAISYWPNPWVTAATAKVPTTASTSFRDNLKPQSFSMLKLGQKIQKFGEYVLSIVGQMFGGQCPVGMLIASILVSVGGPSVGHCPNAC